MNTVHMSKITLIASRAVHTLKNLSDRAHCMLRGEKYETCPGPQWQQLELPFTRTPVRRWNR